MVRRMARGADAMRYRAHGNRWKEGQAITDMTMSGSIKVYGVHAAGDALALSGEEPETEWVPGGISQSGGCTDA